MPLADAMVPGRSVHRHRVMIALNVIPAAVVWKAPNLSNQIFKPSKWPEKKVSTSPPAAVLLIRLGKQQAARRDAKAHKRPTVILGAVLHVYVGANKMKSTNPKILRSQMWAYLDFAASEPLRILRRLGQSYP
jgi:hypothetical protein